ncbi:HTH cro/C1-type domain-containing protein [Aphelenchoides besseyi]|nr:HTH cro/C1-type domain-containing protein [Aphelenchoides besseyi]KAI6211973.1 HTH cro/C1-type domain-containing protein [Aphelenchoides besseyi]
MSKMGRLESNVDPNEVVILRKNRGPVKTLKSQAELNAAARQGIPLDTTKKYAAGSNRQHKSDKNTLRLDEETEVLHHDRVPLELGKVIQQARGAKEWTQKDLSTRINEKVEVVREYENGKAIPNQQTINKMERALGVRLRGKDMGKPLPAKTTTK